MVAMVVMLTITGCASNKVAPYPFDATNLIEPSPGLRIAREWYFRDIDIPIHELFYRHDYHQTPTETDMHLKLMASLPSFKYGFEAEWSWEDDWFVGIKRPLYKYTEEMPELALEIYKRWHEDDELRYLLNRASTIALTNYRCTMLDILLGIDEDQQVEWVFLFNYRDSKLVAVFREV